MGLFPGSAFAGAVLGSLFRAVGDIPGFPLEGLAKMLGCLCDRSGEPIASQIATQHPHIHRCRNPIESSPGSNRKVPTHFGYMTDHIISSVGSFFSDSK